MAKKNSRKAGRINIPPPPPVSPASRLLVFLAIAALLVAVGALHIEYATGGANRYFFLDHAPMAEFYPLLAEYGLPLPAGVAAYNQIYPDLMFMLLLSTIAQNAFVGMHLFAVLCVLVTALGCWLLAREFWGERVAYLSLLLVALPSVLMAHGFYEELFVTAIMPAFRIGLLALLPLLLWLSVRVLFLRRRRNLAAAVLFANLFLLFMSFKIIAVWYVVPVLLAFVCCFAAKKKMSGVMLFAAVVVAAYGLAQLSGVQFIALFFQFPAAVDQVGVSFSWLAFKKSALLFGIYLVDAVSRMPVLVLLWAGLLSLLLRQVVIAPLQAVVWRSKVRSYDLRQNMFLFAALFVVFSMLVPPAVAVVTGKFGVWGRLEHMANHRYFSPAVYWGLFWGWLLLAGVAAKYWQTWTGGEFSRWTKWAAEFFAAVVLLVALTSYINISALAKLASYSTPFLECAEENITKRNLEEGYATPDFAVNLRVFTDGRVNPYPVLNGNALRRGNSGAKQFPFVRHPQRLLYEVDDSPPKNPRYVVVNWTDEAKYLTRPANARCPQRLSEPDTCYDQGKWVYTDYQFIGGKLVTDYFGEPNETFRCEGVDFYVYASGRLNKASANNLL